MSEQEQPVVLFGGTGQVGRETRLQIAPWWPVLAPPRTEVDLYDPDAVRAFLRLAKPALIINAAAYTDVEKAEDDEERAMDLNAELPGLLAQESKARGIGLIHFSTDYVFDGAGGSGRRVTADGRRAYRETDRPAPLNVYGRSKLRGELAIGAADPAYLILRTSWVYGRRGRNFLLTMQRLARERDALSVVADQIGTPTWSRAIARATNELVRKTAAHLTADAIAERAGTYHLAARGEVSWHGFAEAIVSAMDPAARDWPSGKAKPPVNPIATADYPTKAQRPLLSVLDTRMMEDTFALTMPDWRDQLRECLTSGPG
jgi:dTDP-4-dehydrorhamnose reductase